MIQRLSLTGLLCAAALTQFLPVSASKEVQKEDLAVAEKTVDEAVAVTYPTPDNHTFELPSGWNESQKTTIYTFSPSEKDSKTTVSLGIMSQSVDESVTLDDIFKEVVSGMFLQDNVELDDLEINGVPCKKISSKTFVHGIEVSIYQYYLVVKNMKYSLFFFVYPNEEFGNYTKNIESIVSSFQFL